MEVPHRGAHRSVSHPRLNLDDAGSVDRKRTEGVPEVVEAQLAQSGSYHCGLESPAERRPVEVLACLTREHEILGACEARPLAQSRQRLRHLRGEWDRPPLPGLRRHDSPVAVVPLHPQRPALEIDIAPPQGQQLAPP